MPLGEQQTTMQQPPVAHEQGAGFVEAAKGAAHDVYQAAADTAAATAEFVGLKPEPPGYERAHHAKEEAKDAAWEAKEAARRGAQEGAYKADRAAYEASQKPLGERAQEAAAHARDNIADVANRAAEAIGLKERPLSEKAKGAASDAWDATHQAAHRAADKAEDAAWEAKQRTRREEPAFTTDRAAYEARQKPFGEIVQEAAGDVRDSIAAVANGAAEAVGLKERPLSEKAKGAASDAWDATHQAAHRAADKAEDAAWEAKRKTA